MSQRDDLETLRKGLLASFETCEDAVRAQIAGQLRQVVKDLAALGEVTSEVSAADELKRRREARRGGAADSAPASRRGQSRRRGGSNRAG